jgi:predicted DsbA family dithiol-disulfide isomerase
VFYIDVAKVDRDVAHVAMVFSSVCPKCFICFRRMLQAFHLNVAKLDMDVAYTCMLQEYVSSILGVSYVCC